MRRAWEVEKASKDKETRSTATTRLARLDVIKSLRRFAAMAKKPAVAEAAGRRRRRRRAPSWWQPAVHDAALVSGSLRHGFGHFKDIFKDASLFPSAAAAEANGAKLKELKAFALQRLRLVVDATKATLPPGAKPAPAAPSHKAAKALPAALLATDRKLQEAKAAEARARAAEAKAKAEAAEAAAKAKAEAGASEGAAGKPPKADATGVSPTTKAPAGAPKVVSLSEFKGKLESDSEDDVPLAMARGGGKP